MINLIFAFIPAVLLIFIAIGMVDPEKVLWWVERPSRWKVAGYGLALFVAFATAQSMYQTIWEPSPPKSPGKQADSSSQTRTATQSAKKKAPEPKPQGYTTTSQDLQEASRAIKKAMAVANNQAEKNIFKSFRITDNGRIIYITISDDWYYVEEFMKERMTKVVGKRITNIAAETRISYKNGEFSRPIIWFKDTHGEALAHGIGTSWKIEK